MQGVRGCVPGSATLPASCRKAIVNLSLGVTHVERFGQQLDDDSYGYDFRFTHRRTRLHVEVKATAGDKTQFDLGISEIGAATRLARGRGGRWRILRVRQALSSSPEFDWLPNPFQEGFKQHFRLHKGGMRVSYRRKRT